MHTFIIYYNYLFKITISFCVNQLKSIKLRLVLKYYETMVTVSPSCDFSNQVKMMQIPYTFVYVVCVWARVLHISFASEIEFTFFTSQLKMSPSLKQLFERMTTASNAIEDEKRYITETLFISISFNTEDIFKVLHSANLNEIKSYLAKVKEGFDRAQAT